MEKLADFTETFLGKIIFSVIIPIIISFLIVLLY